LDGNLVLQNVPTPTASGIELRRAQFSTLTEALDYAARGLSGFNYYNGRGELTTVLPYSQMRARARALARRLAGGPALAYANTKVLLSRELDLDLAGAIELEAQTQALLMTTRDHREFLDAFREKREPRWEGR
jgi:enoyl-CoA hydratase/carnithine racemase